AFGTPNGGRRKAPPIARRTAPPRTPRRGATAAVGRLSIRKLVRIEVARIGALKELRIFESGAGVEDDDLFVLADPSLAAQLRRCGDRGSPFRTDEHPLRPAGALHGGLDLPLADGHGDAGGVTERLGDADAGGEGPRIGPGLRLVGSLGERLDDRRTTLGLSGNEAWLFRVEPADRSELVECLPHADEADAAAGRVHDHLWHAPSELFRKLEPHRFLTFNAIGLAQGRRVVPAVALLRAL